MLKPLVIASLIVTIGGVFAADVPLRVEKSSTSQEFDAASEVKAHYVALLKGSATVKKQFDALAKQSKLYGDVHFGAGEPQVEWHPRRDEWTAGADFQFDRRFLVIQPLVFGRPKWLSSEAAVVAEFRVLHSGKTRIAEGDPDEKPQLVTNTTRVEFLGFRRFQLTPART